MHRMLTYDLGNASSSKVIHIQPETLLEGCGGPGSFEIFLAVSFLCVCHCAHVSVHKIPEGVAGCLYHSSPYFLFFF